MELYQAGLGDSALDTARCALSTCLSPERGKSFGSQPLVCLFKIGVFESRPALPTFSDTWDVKQVFNYLKGLHPPDRLTLKDLRYKVVMFMALLSCQRRQTLHSFDVDNMHLSCYKTI